MNVEFTNLTVTKTYMFMRFLIYGIIVLLLSCQSKNKENSEHHISATNDLNNNVDSGKNRDIYTRAAIETCNCFSTWVNKAGHLEDARRQKQTAAYVQISKDMNALWPQVNQCSESIFKKYAVIQSGEAKSRVLVIMKEQCPLVAELFKPPLSQSR